MLYIFGVRIEQNAILVRGLMQIYGIGLTKSKNIVRSLGLVESIRLKKF